MSDPERQSEIIALMRDVLGSSYTQLHVKRVMIEENMEEGTTAVTCEVRDEGSAETSVIAGKGVGVIDALFQGVHSRFAEEYPSLKTIRFSSFNLDAQLDTGEAFSATDSQATIAVEIANSEDQRFSFSHTSRSVNAASIVTTLRGLEYFINSERAFVSMYHALGDAEERNRSDLVQRYTGILAILVQNTSYSEVISKIKEDIKKL
jgi:hypothetical protein